MAALIAGRLRSVRKPSANIADDEQRDFVRQAQHDHRHGRGEEAEHHHRAPAETI